MKDYNDIEIPSKKFLIKPISDYFKSNFASNRVLLTAAEILKVGKDLDPKFVGKIIIYNEVLADDIIIKKTENLKLLPDGGWLTIEPKQ